MSCSRTFGHGLQPGVSLPRASANLVEQLLLRMNRYAKVVAEKALRWTGLAAVSRVAHRHHVAVLAFHNIVPHGEPIVGDRSLHLEQHKFAQQLDWLGRMYEIVPLTAIFNQQRRQRRPRAVITFDDAYRGAIVAGVKELVDRNMPATIFVAPGFIGGRSFWWDMLRREGNGAPNAEIRQYCVEALGGQHDRVVAWAKEKGIAIPSVPPHQTTATEQQLTTCLRSGRITFGSHTWSHPNLSLLGNSSRLEAELRKSLDWLQARFEQVVPWLAYPYGIATNEAARAAQRLGYHGALLVSGGLIRHSDLNGRRFMLPRLNIPSGLSLDGLALRGSGVLSS